VRKALVSSVTGIKKKRTPDGRKKGGKKKRFKEQWGEERREHVTLP